MKSNMMKKTLAVALSATMVMGMSITAFAEEMDPAPAGGTTGTAPIYSFDVQNVVVPTTFVTAFNPDELAVKTGSTSSTAQVLSQNYGILNKSSKDKIVTVDLTITDKNNTGADDEKIVTFVNSAAEVDEADKETYAIHLTAIPAKDNTVQVGDTPADADKDTPASDLGNVTMAQAEADQQVTLNAGSNQMGFKLAKAIYSPISGSEVTLGTTTSNDVTSNYELTGVAASNAGITAFTFGGEVNKKADWTKLSQGIEFSATYSFADVEGEEIVTGTGAMVELDAAPTFATGTGVGEIALNAGKGQKAFASIEQITAPWNNAPLDLKSYTTVSADKTKITIDGILGGFARENINPTVTITYKNVAGETKTGTVVIKSK